MASREPSRTPPRSVTDAYEYDPKLRLEQQVGLDRLRCIPDRRMAAALHALYLAISEKPRERTPGAEGTKKRPSKPDLRKMEILAARALAGELGFEAKELAQYFLVDKVGREQRAEAYLRKFAHALAALRGP